MRQIAAQFASFATILVCTKILKAFGVNAASVLHRCSSVDREARRAE